MKLHFTVALFAVVLAFSCLADENPTREFSLPGGKHGSLLGCDFTWVAFKTKAGTVALDWWDLDLATADAVGRDKEYFKIVDQKTVGKGTNAVTRSIILQKQPDGRKRHCIVSQNHSGKTIDTETLFSDCFTAVPYFVDGNTIVKDPEFYIVAYRDMDMDGRLERLRFSRILAPSFKCQKTFVTGAVVSTNIQPWFTGFKSGNVFYMYNLLTTNIPTPPVRSATHTNLLIFEGREYPLQDLVYQPGVYGFGQATIGEWKKMPNQ